MDGHEEEFRRPTLLIFECAIRNEDEEKVVINALKAATEKMINLDTPRTGCPVFGFSKVKKMEGKKNEDEDKNKPRIMHFLECYMGLDSWLDQLSKDEATIISDMFLKYINDYIRGMIVNPYISSDTFRISLVDSLRAMTVVPKYGEAFNVESIVNPQSKKLEDKMKPSTSTVEIELFIEPLETDKNGKMLLEACKPLIPEVRPLSPWISCIIPNWKHNKFISIRNKLNSEVEEENRKSLPLKLNDLKPFHSEFTKDAYTVLLVTSSPDVFLKDIFKKDIVQNILNNSKRHELNYIAPNLDNKENQTTLKYLKELGINIKETREVVAGYLLHPAFAKGWKGKQNQPNTSSNETEKIPSANISTSVTNTSSVLPVALAPPAPTPPPAPISPPYSSTYVQKNNKSNGKNKEEDLIPCEGDVPYFFKRKNPLSNKIETYVFDKSFIQKKFGYKRVQAQTIPVYAVASFFCGIGKMDNEMPVQTLFSYLERFRNLLVEAKYFNETSTDVIEKDPFIADRIHKFSDLVSRMGFDITSEEKPNVTFSGLQVLINEIEKEYKHIIEAARVASANPIRGKIDYMGLQEYYRIGKNVISTKVNALNGVPIMYRIIDSYYDQLRSMFGNKKFNFHLVLETTVKTGKEYVCVYFENFIPDWNNDKEISSLEYQVVNDESQIPNCIFQYSKIFESLGQFPAYRKYQPNTFIPHQKKAIGGASSMKSLATDGLLVVDTELGMSMNYHLVSNADTVSEAILVTMRDYMRLTKVNNKEQDTEEKRFERYKSSSLHVYRSLPEQLKLTLWPTVVAFSLTQKIWGYAIVSGLESVTPSSVAWSQLVLPTATKEMLFATVAASLRGEHRIDCGIQYDELAHDKEASYAMQLLAKPPRYKARDIISSRGVGSLFLLYGSPGTGKTLTVESLARLFGRPLYSVSFAELGSNVTELEERLTDVLFLASHWGSLILLDEGDALVEKRRSGQLMLNSMTSILLRLLESFDGTLFITSNRAASFDPAALSRVTLAIQYKPLEETGKEVVWKNALSRVFAEEIVNNEKRGEKAAEEHVIKTFDLKKLGQFKGSGRSVNAVIRLAIGLADKRDETLTQKIVQDAIDVYTAFNEELVKECPEEWD